MRTLSSKLTAITLGSALAVLFFFHQTYDFNDKNPGKNILITIPDGATGVEIGNILENSNVIKSQKFFVDFYLANQSAKGISPGIHKVESHISTKRAVGQLLDQGRIESAVTVKEGSTFSDVIELLNKSKNVISHSVDSKSLKLPLQNRRNSVEGQLFPAIYSFEPGTTSQVAVQKMLDRFKTSMDSIPLKGYKKYTPYEVLTIASIIQVEGDLGDFNKVARVIYNRLAINMPLQLNSTVQYAAGLRGRIALSTKATNISSPYNTYRNLGLPPSPISNPSAAAIRAAGQPGDGDWLYFITVKPGDTRFTKDYAEFSKWNTIYNNNLANGLFK